ncbi:MAG: PKD domain-containing protein [Nitrospiria bacterium]
MSQGIEKAILAPLLGLVVTAVALFLLPTPGTWATTLTFNSNIASIDTSASSTLTCPGETTLEELITCIESQMPTKDSEEFVVPTSTVQSDWRNVVDQMLDGNCDNIPLPVSLTGVYSVSTFNDTDNGQSYCVLMEVLDQDDSGKVDRGWGTFIVNAHPYRELSIQVTHPKNDLNTPMQGIGVFKGSNSRSFLMAGSHRYANSITSTCQASYEQADVAHNVENLFQPTVQELLEFYGGTEGGVVAIQFHGMGTSSCSGVDVHLTHGLNTPPVAGDKIVDLKSNLLSYNPTWTVTVPGDSPSCDLVGSFNVQGRLLNNVAAGAVCTTAAVSYSGSFIHIEQKSCCRNANDWINAINDTWSPNLTVTKQASPNPVPVGAQLTYTLRVTNTGETLLHLTITDTLPAHVTPTGILTWTPTISTFGGVWTQTVIITAEIGYIGLLTNIVQVTSEEGVTGTYTHTVSIEEPIAGLTVTDDSPTPLGQITTLTATVTAGSNATYTWAFGDGETGSGATVTHTYPVTGIHTAVVTASNSVSMLTATTTVTIRYYIYLPVIEKEN